MYVTLKLYAEVAQENAKQGFTLPLQPLIRELSIFSHFWVDNFDVLVDNQSGRRFHEHYPHSGFSINGNGNATNENKSISVPKRKSSSMMSASKPYPSAKKKETPSNFSVRAKMKKSISTALT